MTALVDMKLGQWALAFAQEYYFPGSDMAEQLERFATRGAGWDSHLAPEMFLIHRVESVAPKTYQASESLGSKRWRAQPAGRYYRLHVMRAFSSPEAAIALRDKFFAIGSDADDRIEAEMYRRIEKFADREHGKALKRIHKLLPRFFGSTK
jgi:hypothetical protein